MSDPNRLLDRSADELERALLHAGSSYGASPELREKTLAALGITGAAAALGTGAALSGSGAKLGASSLLAKLGSVKVAVLAVGVAAGAALTLPAAISSLRPAPAAPTRFEPARVSPRPAGAAVPQVPAEISPPARPVAAQPALPVASSASQPPRTPTASSKPLSSAEALRVELAQLDAARSKLASGRTEEALALLDAYDRSAPRGMLKLEAEVLRIDALSRSGRMALAQSRAKAFLERYPKSVLAARVRRLAGQ